MPRPPPASGNCHNQELCTSDGDALLTFPVRRLPCLPQRPFLPCNSHQKVPQLAVPRPASVSPIEGAPVVAAEILATPGTLEALPAAQGSERGPRGLSWAGLCRAKPSGAWPLPGAGRARSGAAGAKGSGEERRRLLFPRGGSPMQTAPATSSGRKQPAPAAPLPRGAVGDGRAGPDRTRWERRSPICPGRENTLHLRSATGDFPLLFQGSGTSI